MPSPLSAQRLAVFIDVQNIYYPAKSLGDKVNFHSLLKRFSTRQLIRAIAYVVEAPDVDVTPFVVALRNIGFEVRTKAMRVFDDGTRKGDIHLMLALDAMSIAGNIDVVCLVTGDGEYVDLVHLLQGRGIKVEVMSFKANTSAELIRVADEHIPMNEEFLLGHGAQRGEERFSERGRAFGEERPARSLPYRSASGRDLRTAPAPRRDDRYAPRPLRDERLPREERPYRDERSPYRDERPGRDERLPLREERGARLDDDERPARSEADEESSVS